MKKLFALVLTAVMLAGTSVCALADEAVAAEPLVLDGRTQVTVTSSDTNLDVDVANFYDLVPETKCIITFDAAEETKTFSVYTATKVPEAITSFAAVLDGEKGTVVTIETYGANDSLLLDWTPLAIEAESLDSEYAIFGLTDNTAAYAFYRFDFTLEVGDYFELAELALYKPTTDAPEMMYDIGSVVEEGEIPALIPVEEEPTGAIAEQAVEAVEEVAEVADDTTAPTFGLFTSYPLPMFKFLPRG